MVRTPKVRKNDTRADARRRQLLDAAEACFADHGFHAAGMARISDQAGMSIGNIYGYFENKDAIICAIVDAQVSAMQAGLERLLESTGDIAEAFKQQAAVQIRNCTLENRSALMFDIMAEMGRNPVIATAMQAHDEKVRRQLLGKSSGRSTSSSRNNKPDTMLRGASRCRMVAGRDIFLRN